METYMKKKIIYSIVFIGIIIAAIVIFIIIKANSFKGYDEGTTANTPLNLINGGMFCEDDNRIYFANPNNKNYLYSMNNDLSDFKLIKKNCVSYINAKSPYIFYSVLDTSGTSFNMLGYKNTGLYRTKISNGSTKILDENPTGLIALYGNSVYYQHYEKSSGLTLYEANINGDEKKRIHKDPYIPTMYENGEMIFPGTDSNQYITSYSVSTGSTSTKKNVRAMNIGATKEYYYYMDIDNNYTINRIAKNSSTPATLVEERCASYNLSHDERYLYYQVDDGENNGFYKLDLITMRSTQIKEGNYKNICTTTNYVFFTDVYESKIYYCKYSNDKVEVLNPPSEE